MPFSYTADISEVETMLSLKREVITDASYHRWLIFRKRFSEFIRAEKRSLQYTNKPLLSISSESTKVETPP